MYELETNFKYEDNNIIKISQKLVYRHFKLKLTALMHFTSGKQLIIKQMGDIPRLEISGKHVSQKFPCIAELQACCFSGKKCDYD